MTIGDILGVIAAVTLFAASWAATLLLAALAFPARAARAQQRIMMAAGRCFWLGFFTLLLVGVLAIALGQSPVGPLRIVGGALWTGLAAVSALGSAGIVRLLGERIEATGTQMPPFASLTRGTLLFVTAAFLPIVGWFLILPVAALIGLGAGLVALRARKDTLQLHTSDSLEPASWWSPAA